MATKAICGRTCSAKINDSDEFEGTNFVLTVNAPEINTTHFGSGEFGDYITCFKEGTIDLETNYIATGLEAGDACAGVFVVGTTTFTANSLLCTKAQVTVPAPEVVKYSYSFRLTDTMTGW